MKNEEPKPIHQQIIDIVGGEDKFREIARLKRKNNKTMENKQTAEKLTAMEQLINWIDSDCTPMDCVMKAKELLSIEKEQVKKMHTEEEVYDLLVEWNMYQKGESRVDEDEIPNGFMSFNEWFKKISKQQDNDKI
jgi:hypothetical protein